MKQSEIIKDLIARTEENIKIVEGFKNIDSRILNKNPTEKSWNALQCIEHLNRYSTFYLLEFNKRLKNSTLTLNDEFKSGFWGKKFTEGMLPDEKMKTMSTFKSKNPAKEEVSSQVIPVFIQQQKEFLCILEKAKKVDLNTNACKITIPLLKMGLGDTLRFYTFHNVRHIVQAQKAVNNS